MPRAYLDHASSTPLRPAAAEAMVPWLSAPGDPGRVHAEGRAARFALEEARAEVAAFLGARPREVVFTSGGTEAVNAAVFGATVAGAGHVVVSAVEHSAVLEAAERSGRVSAVPVDRHGRVDPEAVAAAVEPGTALVCVQAANHEVGTLQPVSQVAENCRDRKVPFHVDACASAGYVALDFSGLGADLVSVSAHKLGGPQGIGALVVRRGLRIAPFVVGGAQERARRAGLENVAAAVGFAAACAELAEGDRLEAEAKTARYLTDRILGEAPALVEGVCVYGDPVGRLPHLVCLGVEGVEAEPVLLGLDQRGVAVHSGSSCSSETFEPSPVLRAMGVDAEHSLRISVGWSSTEADVDAFLSAFPEVVGRLRSLRAG